MGKRSGEKKGAVRKGWVEEVGSRSTGWGLRGLRSRDMVVVMIRIKKWFGMKENFEAPNEGKRERRGEGRR